MFADMDEVKCKQGCFGVGVALLLHCFIRLLFVIAFKSLLQS